jgi:hypothetical protein
MKKLKLLIELEYNDDAMHGTEQESIDWFNNDILKGDELVLHCNNIGDTIGVIKTLSIEECL